MGARDSNDLGIRPQSVPNAGVLCCMRLIMAFVVPRKPRMENLQNENVLHSRLQALNSIAVSTIILVFGLPLGSKPGKIVRGHCVGRFVLGEPRRCGGLSGARGGPFDVAQGKPSQQCEQRKSLHDRL